MKKDVKIYLISRMKKFIIVGSKYGFNIKRKNK